MKIQHYSRKKRQLANLARQLATQVNRSSVNATSILKLKYKIRQLLCELKTIFSVITLRKALGSAALFFTFSLTQEVSAQNFIAPVSNPFGIAPTTYFIGFNELADIDNDGDLDLFASEAYGIMLYYENTGTATAPAFAAPIQNPFGLTATNYIAAMAIADLDGDGDLDILVGEGTGGMRYFENTGTASAPAFAAPQNNPFGLSNVYYMAFPTFVDLDGDGDMDLLVGEYYGAMNYFENTGTATAPAFAAAVQNPFGITSAYYYALPEFVDLDGDGDMDLLVGEYYGAMNYFENTGTATAPAFAPLVVNPFGLVNAGAIAIPGFADIDGDGDLDLFSGTGYGTDGLLYYENTQISAIGENVAEQLRVYPNPFENMLQLDNKQERYTAKVYNLLGELVYSQQQVSGSLSLGQLEIGFYVLRLSDNEGRVYEKKIQKN